MVNQPIQFYRSPIMNVYSRTTMTIKQVYQYITSLEPMERTHRLRAFENEDDAKKFKKKNFDFVTFAGTFSRRKAEGLIEHSGMMVLDFDHVGNARQLWALREKILQDPTLQTELMFTSPSGDGLKLVVDIDLAFGNHLQWFWVFQIYFRTNYRLEIDELCSDVCRACFLPHDASCYVNPIVLQEPDVCPF